MRIPLLLVVVLAPVLLAPLASAQEGDLSLLLEPASASTALGVAVATDLTVTNNGLRILEIELRAPNTTQVDVAFATPRFFLNPGAAEQVRATLFTNRSEVGTFLVPLVAQEVTAVGGDGTARAEARFQLTVVADREESGNASTNTTQPDLHAPELSPRYQLHTATLGDNVTFRVSVRNPNNDSLLVNLSAMAVDVDTRTTPAATQLLLAPQEIRSVAIEATSPRDADRGLVRVDVEGSTGNDTAYVDLAWEAKPPANESEVNETHHPPEINPRSHEYEADAGEVIEFGLSVRNPNNFSLSVMLGVRTTFNLTPTISETLVDVGPQETRMFRVQARPHANTTHGYVWIDADALTGNDTVFASLRWRAPTNDTPSPDEQPAEEVAPAPPALSPGGWTVNATPGETRIVVFSLQNVDAPPEHQLRLELPAGWNGSVAPGASVRVEAGGSVELRVEVEAGTEAVNGTGRLVATGAGGEAVGSLFLNVLRATPPPEEPSEPRLVVDPVRLVLAPGGAAVAHVRVERADPTLLEGDLQVEAPPGFLLEWTDALAQGARSFILRAPADAVEGALLPGNATLPGFAPASFVIEVAPALQTAGDADAPGEAGLPALGLAVAATGVGAAALGGAYAWRRWRWALLGLFTRLKRSQTLEHPLRARVHALLRERPGMSFGELQRALDIANGHLRHHLRHLESAGHVQSVADGQMRRFYVTGTRPSSQAAPLAARVLAAVEARGAVRAAALAAELGVSRQALHYHVKNLVRQGRLVANAEGGELVLTPGAAQAPAQRERL